MDAFKPTGIGQVAAKNVIRVTTSQPLSTNPKFQGWDDENLNTTLNDIFVGTAGNGNKPMVGAIGMLVQPSASWWVEALIAGAAVNNGSLLKGSLGFVLLTSTPPGVSGQMFINLDYRIPHDLDPAAIVAHSLSLEIQYTGPPPSLTWEANKGTEGTPVWQALVSSIKGSAIAIGGTEIRPCDVGSGGDGTETYKLSIPASGQIFVEEIWFKDHEA